MGLGWPQPPERLSHRAPARGGLTSPSARGRGARESRGWGCLAGAGGCCQDVLPPRVPGRGYHQAAVDPQASLPGSGPGHPGLQRAGPGLGLRLKPAVSLQVSVDTASPRDQELACPLPGPPYLGTAAWPAGTLRLCGRGRQRAGARRPAAPAGEGGSVRSSATGAAPGAQGRAGRAGRPWAPGAAPGFPSLGGSTKQCPLCPGLAAHHGCPGTGWAGVGQALRLPPSHTRGPRIAV